MGRRLATFLIAVLPAQATLAAGCGMKPAFVQPDRGGTSSVSVWRDDAGASLLFADAMNVNTDGTRRSYSVSDFWGEGDPKGAINNLCNAMSDACAGLSKEQKKERRELTQRARTDGWPASALARTRISSSIIPFKDGRPCPEVDGFLVSATALRSPGITDPCDPRGYADALETSSIVLPKRTRGAGPTPFEQRGAKLGDLVVVMSGDRAKVKYAVVGDTGPSAELGEISVALAGALLGRSEPPVNYLQVRGRHPFEGQGWTVGNTYTLVFSGTRDSVRPYLTQARIDAAAKSRFDAWGGVERMKACAAVYRPR